MKKIKNLFVICLLFKSFGVYSQVTYEFDYEYKYGGKVLSVTLDNMFLLLNCSETNFKLVMEKYKYKPLQDYFIAGVKLGSPRFQIQREYGSITFICTISNGELEKIIGELSRLRIYPTYKESLEIYKLTKNIDGNSRNIQVSILRNFNGASLARMEGF